MISFLSNFIALFLYKNNIIDKEKIEVCQYGFEIIISTIIGFLLVLASGIILGEIPEAILFYCRAFEKKSVKRQQTVIK